MASAGELDDWVVRRRSDPDGQLRLFCLPYAGGGASIFGQWSDQLPPDVEVVPVQLPGRESFWKQDPFTEMEPLVRALVQVLGSYLDRPFAFYGHSMGGLIGFEVARELRRQNKPSPVHLFVSATRAPQLPNPDPPMSELPEVEFIAELDRRYGGAEQLPQDVELMKLIVPLLRADVALCEAYTYESEAPLDCALSIFGGLEDPRANREELGAWRVQSRSSCSLRMLPGGHFFLHSSQASFLRVLSRQLYQVARRLRRRA